MHRTSAVEGDLVDLIVQDGLEIGPNSLGLWLRGARMKRSYTVMCAVPFVSHVDLRVTRGRREL